jgi:putative protein-disulfide isomerase
MNLPKMHYVSDPMCSWCWGFAPVMDSIRRDFGESMDIQLIVGGLRPGTKEALTDEWRDFVLHHWEEVHKLTGQPFNFEFNMPAGWRYDTEPADRAVVSVRQLQADAAIDYLEAVQAAFYVENRDVTDETVLADLADDEGVSRYEFLEKFNADQTRWSTQSDVGRARSYGITGFPSIVLEDAREPILLTFGYQPYDVLQPRIEQWLGEAVFE